MVVLSVLSIHCCNLKNNFLPSRYQIGFLSESHWKRHWQENYSFLFWKKWNIFLENKKYFLFQSKIRFGVTMKVSCQSEFLSSLNQRTFPQTIAELSMLSWVYYTVPRVEDLHQNAKWERWLHNWHPVRNIANVLLDLEEWLEIYILPLCKSSQMAKVK